MSINLIKMAINNNYTRKINKIHYGTNFDFAKDCLHECLKFNIISAYASEDPVWKKYNIKIKDIINPPCLKFINPFSDPGERPQIYWNYDVKNVILPYGWYLSDNIYEYSNPGTFSIINDTGEIIKTLNFFQQFEYCVY